MQFNTGFEKTFDKEIAKNEEAAKPLRDRFR